MEQTYIQQCKIFLNSGTYIQLGPTIKKNMPTLYTPHYFKKYRKKKKTHTLQATITYPTTVGSRTLIFPTAFGWDILGLGFLRSDPAKRAAYDAGKLSDLVAAMLFFEEHKNGKRRAP